MGLGEKSRSSSKLLSLVACASGGSLFFIFLIIACVSPLPGFPPPPPDGLIPERFGSKRRRFMPCFDASCPSNSHTARVLDTALQLAQQRIKSAGGWAETKPGKVVRASNRVGGNQHACCTPYHGSHRTRSSLQTTSLTQEPHLDRSLIARAINYPIHLFKSPPHPPPQSNPSTPSSPDTTDSPTYALSRLHPSS